MNEHTQFFGTGAQGSGRSLALHRAQVEGTRATSTARGIADLLKACTVTRYFSAGRGFRQLPATFPAPQPHERIVFFFKRWQNESHPALQETLRSTPYPHAILELITADRVASARALLASARAYKSLQGDLELWAKVLAEPVLKMSDETGPDRSGDYEWLLRHSDEYRDRWVALLDGGLVAHATRLAELVRILRERNLLRVALVHRVE